MERAGRLIGNLKIPKEVLEPEALARTAWPSAVGQKLAAHLKAVRLVRSCLVVECEDLVWQTHAYTLRSQVLGNLQRILGPGVVTSLDLRPMVPRRGPQTASQPRPAQSAAAASAGDDEADSISDAVFRHLYKKSRRIEVRKQQQLALAFDSAPAPQSARLAKKVSA